MLTHPVSDFISTSGALCEAVLRLRGKVLHEELGRIARRLLASPYGVFEPADADSGTGQVEGEPLPYSVERLRQEVAFDGHYFGCYRVFGRASFNATDRHHLASLAKLTASLLHVHSLAQRSTHAFVQVESQLAHQLQVLDQIQESVLTLDQTGCSATARSRRSATTSCSCTWMKTPATTTALSSGADA
jgi:hypothetical protein